MDHLKRIQELTDLVAHHDHLYYNLSDPEISDADYDALRQELQTLEQTYPQYIQPNSPRYRVGILPLSDFEKVTHKVPMLSLDNVFSDEELKDFMQKAYRFLNNDQWVDYVAEPKIDGLSASLVYENGILSRVVTRGDGQTGEDITQNAKTIRDIPLKLASGTSLAIEPWLEVRGEIYMEKEAFATLNDNRAKDNEPLFANPRNAAAGSVRQLDSRIVAKRPLRFFAYYLAIESANMTLQTQWDLLTNLKLLGFQVSPQINKCCTFSHMQEYYQNIANIRSDLPYDIDGIVFKMNSLALQKRLGFSGRTPRFAIAYKFPPQQGQTLLEDIIVQVGRNGTLTPVAVLKPINVGGVWIQRASLHNADEITRKDVRIGDLVTIQRAGDVIPQVIEAKRQGHAEPFVFPDTCPSCGSEVHRDQVAIYCPNVHGCPAQIKEKISHFVSRDALDIEGFGKSRVDFLYEKGYIKTLIDIFHLSDHKDVLKELPGFGLLSVENLIAAIDQARHVKLDRFIYALGIPMIGTVTAGLLAKHFTTVEKFITASLGTKDELLDISGIGPIAQQELFYFLEHNQQLLQQLIQEIHVQPCIVRTDLPLSGKTVVFTGTLTISRNEAKLQAQNLGAMIGASVTKKTDLLVVGEDPGSKYKKALEWGIPVMTEAQWQQLQ